VSTPTEAKTRKELIDPALKKAGWDVGNVELPTGVSDYALYRPKGQGKRQ